MQGGNAPRLNVGFLSVVLKYQIMSAPTVVASASTPDLPGSPTLDISALSAAFRDKSASYKYLWMQAILRAIERGEFTNGVAPIPLLAAHMLDIAKYPLRRFHLSFGWEGHDKVDVAFRDLEDAAGWHDLKEGLFEQDIAARYSQIPPYVCKRLVDFVPYRLLTPFFGDALTGLGAGAKQRKIIRLAGEQFVSRRPPFYRFAKGGACIEMHSDWMAYMSSNHGNPARVGALALVQILARAQSACSRYPPKIGKTRGAGFVQATPILALDYWKAGGEIRCIYSGEVLRAENFAVDHYVPWDYIAHDSLWNLIPTKPEVNSAKSNLLPNDDYFPEFVKTQRLALSTFCDSGRPEWKPLMESYFVDLRLRHMPTIGEPAPALDDLQSAYSLVTLPMLRLAENCGYRPGWKWAKNLNNAGALCHNFAVRAIFKGGGKAE